MMIKLKSIYPGKDAILQLVDAIDEYIPVPERDSSSHLFMPVEGAVAVPGRGTVVTGTIQQGTLKKSGT